LWLSILALFGVGYLLFLLYPLKLPQAYFDFADRRSLGFIPNGADVLSNIPIFLAGIFLLRKLQAANAWGKETGAGLAAAGVGLVLTGIGSAYFHQAPSEATLLWDRLPLAITFVGVLLVVLESFTRVPATRRDSAIAVAASLGTVLCWSQAGNIWPYVLLQFGGMTVVVAYVFNRSHRNRALWGALIGFYALAKIFEGADSLLWESTRHLVSGHTLKHLASGLAGFLLLDLVSPSDTANAESKSARETLN
jgi:uncharacterized membrane protein